MMVLERTMFVLLMAAAVAGCRSDVALPHKGGALAFSQSANMLGSTIGDETQDVSPTATGTLLGAFYGTKIGDSLGRADRRYAENAARRSLESSAPGQTVHWHNAGNGHSGTFTPSRMYQTEDDVSCRDYVQSVTAGGRTESATGTACRTKDGWRVAIGTGRPAH